jgi:hypothetical protein
MNEEEIEEIRAEERYRALVLLNQHMSKIFLNYKNTGELEYSELRHEILGY